MLQHPSLQNYSRVTLNPRNETKVTPYIFGVLFGMLEIDRANERCRYLKDANKIRNDASLVSMKPEIWASYLAVKNGTPADYSDNLVDPFLCALHLSPGLAKACKKITLDYELSLRLKSRTVWEALLTGAVKKLRSNTKRFVGRTLRFLEGFGQTVDETVVHLEGMAFEEVLAQFPRFYSVSHLAHCWKVAIRHQASKMRETMFAKKRGFGETVSFEVLTSADKDMLVKGDDPIDLLTELNLSTLREEEKRAVAYLCGMTDSLLESISKTGRLSLALAKKIAKTLKISWTSISSKLGLDCCLLDFIGA